MNGAKALAKPIRNGLFKTPNAAAAALPGLIGVSFEDMRDVIEAVVHIVGALAEHDDVIYKGTIVFVHAAACVLGSAKAAGIERANMQHPFVACVQKARFVLLEFIGTRL